MVRSGTSLEGIYCAALLLENNLRPVIAVGELSFAFESLQDLLSKGGFVLQKIVSVHRVMMDHYPPPGSHQFDHETCIGDGRMAPSDLLDIFV